VRPKRLVSAKKKNLWLTTQQDILLKELEWITGLSQSEHIRRALDDYLKKMREERILK
jgi:hypothetical protein